MSKRICDRIAFIGGGNMATSLIRGLLQSGQPADGIAVSDPVPAQRERLAGLGVTVTGDNNAAARDAAAVVLAVKPQVLTGVLGGLTALHEGQLLVSIAAGIPLATLERGARPGQPVVRCMPNTPALVGAGVTALFANDATPGDQRQLAEQILGAAGRTVWVAEESTLDAVTAVSGSGPAYFFYLMEAMIAAGRDLGLDPETARLLTLETAYGAALMARAEGAPDPATLRANVTSPGGTTERALAVLDARDARGIITAALAAARERSRELAEESG